MKDVTATSFGFVIAFLLPGMLGMYGLGFWSYQVDGLLKPALTTNATLGPTVIVLLCALAIGLILSAVRYFIFEKCVCRGTKLGDDLFARLMKGDRMAAFKEVADAHYRYHQFYGGCFFAALITFSGWIYVHDTSLYSVSCTNIAVMVVAFGLLEWLLWASAVSSFREYVKRGNMVGKEGQTDVKQV